VSILSEGNTFSLEQYLLEMLASGRAVGKLSLSVLGITLPIFLELEATCLVEICSEAMAQSDFDKPLLPSSQKSSAGNLPSTQKFLDTPLLWMKVEAAQVIIILEFFETFVHDFAHVAPEHSHIGAGNEG
jgi:hypothetical protein